MGKAELKATRGWLFGLAVVHAVLVLAVSIYFSSSQIPSSEVVWISEITLQSITFTSRRPDSGTAVSQEKKGILTALREEDRSDFQWVEGSRNNRPRRVQAFLGGEFRRVRLLIKLPAISQATGDNLRNTIPATRHAIRPAEGIAGFVGEPRGDLSSLAVTRHQDWQFGSFEDTKLTYSDPNSPIKVDRS